MHSNDSFEQRLPDSAAAAALIAPVETVLCDLDGVVWLAHEPIQGAVEAISSLRQSGRRVLFVTNNSAALLAEHEAALGAIGVPAVGDVISSSMAAAHLVERGERVLVVGGPGLAEAVVQRGAVAVVNDGTLNSRGERFDAVVVGLHRDFDYDRLASAAAAIHAGARLIGTNSDSTYPTPRGLEPGGGSILAAVATAGGVVPTIAGKPHEPMARAIDAALSTSNARFDPSVAIVVGDRPETDGLMAARLGARFALVRSGVTRPGDVVQRLGRDDDARAESAMENHPGAAAGTAGGAGSDIVIDLDVADLAQVADAILC